jgi:hypothetical protein
MSARDGACEAAAWELDDAAGTGWLSAGRAEALGAAMAASATAVTIVRLMWVVALSMGGSFPGEDAVAVTRS